MANQKITTLEILQCRMKGYSFQEIADEFGCTRQCVDGRLRKLCPHKAEINADDVEYPQFDPVTLDRLLREVIRLHANPIAISNQCGISVDEAQNLINYIFAHKKSWAGLRNPYPAVMQWMRKNMVERDDLARAAGIPPYLFDLILRGQAHMTLKAAQGLKKVTGLSLAEIFKEQTEDISPAVAAA